MEIVELSEQRRPRIAELPEDCQVLGVDSRGAAGAQAQRPGSCASSRTVARSRSRRGPSAGSPTVVPLRTTARADCRWRPPAQASGGRSPAVAIKSSLGGRGLLSLSAPQNPACAERYGRGDYTSARARLLRPGVSCLNER